MPKPQERRFEPNFEDPYVGDEEYYGEFGDKLSDAETRLIYNALLELALIAQDLAMRENDVYSSADPIIDRLLDDEVLTSHNELEGQVIRSALKSLAGSDCNSEIYAILCAKVAKTITPEYLETLKQSRQSAFAQIDDVLAE